ncbi:hypothetical protein LTR85_001475 [Meristemomyces frigidus]|nr:hypothetical protein LTR85_001475 [Meristemomyces frigidus]
MVAPHLDVGKQRFFIRPILLFARYHASLQEIFISSTLRSSDGILRQQEFYLAKDEPVWYWGRAYASNACLKRDFSLLKDLLRDISITEEASGRLLSGLDMRTAKPVGSPSLNLERISALVSRRYIMHGFDNPRRLYRELTAQATNPRDFVYGLRAIFDPVFRRLFVPDYGMRTELLFAILAVFLIQFQCWGDVLWWYPSRYAAGTGLFPSWLPDFTKHIAPHELDVQPHDDVAEESQEPKLVVLNHRLHADGYVLDRVYAHRHLDTSDGQKILQELWQFDYCMNNNHECHEFFLKGAAPEDTWLEVFLKMYKNYYATAEWNEFNSAFRGALLQSTVKPEDVGKLPRQVAECLPCWDLLQWHAMRIAGPGSPGPWRHNSDNAGQGCLEGIFSPRMDTVFRRAFADFFIGACIFDWDHLSVWLNKFPIARRWNKWNDKYWSEIRESLPDDTDKRAKSISDAYDVYEDDIADEVLRVSWCPSFYYAFLAFVILLDCDEHTSLASMILKLQMAGARLRSKYFSITGTQIEELACAVPSVAARVSHYNTVIDLFRGRYLLWTDGGFRGISCPGVETCCDKKSIVAVVDGLSFPVIVRDFNDKTSEGWLAGCAIIRGADMLQRNTEKTELPEDYKRGEKRVFRFR